MKSLFALFLLGAAAVPARADLVYYKDVLIGERASGLGGAFVAISDDPSGIYHNPAGIAFSLENYLNISANAFNTSQQTFENIYPGQNYTYRSKAFVPSFFGFTQTMGKGKFGFAVAVPNSEDIDQDDRADQPGSAGVDPKAFIRKISRQDVLYYVGPAYAREIATNLSMGISFLAKARTFKFIDNTHILFNPVGTGSYAVHEATLTQTSYGGELKVGFEWMPMPKWSFGLVFSKSYNFGGSGRSRILDSKSQADGTPVTPNGNFDHDIDVKAFTKSFYALPVNWAASFGVAYFVSRAGLITAQIDYHSPQNLYSEYPLGKTINWSLGGEYYLADWFALRGGIYSNNPNTRPIVEGGTNQRSYVLQTGGTLGFSIYRSGTSLSLGASYTMGVGRGQAFTGDISIQRVRQSLFGIYFAGSYQL